MTYLKYTINDEKVQYLMHSDKKLRYLLNCIGNSEIAIERDGFRCLVKYIIGQQISDKARETIWKRLNTTIDITPQNILSAQFDELQRAGLSSRKVEYIRTLAQSVSDGEIDFEQLQLLSNQEIINSLTSLRGIGRWTAEMYLIFSLGREDVLAKTDKTIKRVIQWMYGLRALPSSEVLTAYFAKWLDYATIVSAYFWKATALGLTRMPFRTAISKDIKNKNNVYWMNMSIEIAEEQRGAELLVGGVLVSEEDILLCSAFNNIASGRRWSSIMLSELQKKKISRAQSIYVTINTLSTDGVFDLNKLLNKIDIREIYIGLPDPELVSYKDNDPAVWSECVVHRYPIELQHRILRQNANFYIASKQSIKYSPYYFENRISDLIVAHLKLKGFSISKEEFSMDKQRESLVELLCKKYKIQRDEAYTCVCEALSEAFDNKYSTYDYSDDARSIDTEWKEKFFLFYDKIVGRPLSELQILNVGVGSGCEAIELFSDCSGITFADIAQVGLEKIKEQLPSSKTIIANACDLTEIKDDSYDLYVSLRTYNSSFFNIRQAITEAHRVVKCNGMIIVSVANGFLCTAQNRIIAGLIIPGTEFVDLYRGIDTAKVIQKLFIDEGFTNIHLFPTNTEIYLFANVK